MWLQLITQHPDANSGIQVSKSPQCKILEWIPISPAGHNGRGLSLTQMRLKFTSCAFFPWRLLLYQCKNPTNLPHPRNSLMQINRGAVSFTFLLWGWSSMFRWMIICKVYLLIQFYLGHKQGRLKRRQLKHANVINTVTNRAK